MTDIAPISLIDLEELARDHAKPVTDAIPTHLPQWNRACRDEGGGIGLAPGWFVVMAGKPGAGKTLMAINLLIAAMRANTMCCVLSYEMSKSQMLTRALAIATGAGIHRLERGPGYDAQTFREAIDVWDKDGLHYKMLLAERPERTISVMQTHLLDAANYGCRLLIVDYTQLVGRTEHPAIFERVQAVSGVLQQTAFETRCTVIGLSQFNRTTLANRKDEPGTEGLKGGSLDEDADQVVMLDYSDAQKQLTSLTTNFIVGKNRHGPAPTIPIIFDYQTLRVRERTSYDEAVERIRNKEGA